MVENEKKNHLTVYKKLVKEMVWLINAAIREGKCMKGYYKGW